jgi:Flp pilus assembly protein TadG
MVALLITMIDTSIFFSNRSQIQSAARDAARTVGIMGGNGTAAQATPIEVRYGLDRSTACARVTAGSPAAAALKSSSTPIECNLMAALSESRGLINTTFSSVTCSPTFTARVGANVKCEVQWSYGGIPGSALTLVTNADTEKAGVAGQQTTSVSSTSEVGIPSLVAR